MPQISFNAEMLAALRAGSKTVTRRRLQPTLPMQLQPDRYHVAAVTGQTALFKDLEQKAAGTGFSVDCPLGKVGDILEVAEDATLQLQIVNLRVEQVRQLTAADAVAEGLPQKIVAGRQQWGGVEADPAVPGSFRWYDHPIAAFRGLLDTIYPSAWVRNEWVWVVEFVRIHSKPEDHAQNPDK
ncbi:hypothetical protein GCM10027346_39020 [Hymenobacter seoulensis]